MYVDDNKSFKIIMLIKYFSPPDVPHICLNKDVFSNKIGVLRDSKATKGLQLNIFMQAAEMAYLSDNREYRDVEVLFDDTCQVCI